MDLNFQPPLPPQPEPPPETFTVNSGTTQNWVVYQWGNREPYQVPLPQFTWWQRPPEQETRNVVPEDEVDDLAHARRKIALMQKRINELESRAARAERRRRGKK